MTKHKQNWRILDEMFDTDAPDAEYNVVEGAETTRIETEERRNARSVTKRQGMFGPEVVEVHEQTVIKRVETITPLVTVTVRPQADITINMDFGCAHLSPEAPQLPQLPLWAMRTSPKRLL